LAKIVVIGSFMTDLVVRSQRFVNEGETIIGDSFHQFTGGKGANQAVAAARLGASVTMIGKLGEDGFGRAQIASLAENNIDHTHVLFTDQAPSGVGNPQLDATGHNRIVVIPGANALFSAQELDRFEQVIAASDIIIVQLEIPLETVYRAIELAHRFGKVLILNPAPAQALDQRYAPMVSWIVPNEHESSILTGIPVDSLAAAKTAACRLRNMGYRNILITLGSHGAYYKTVDDEGAVAACTVKAVDTTAAGDEFIGAFACGLGEGRGIPESLRFASAASALAVTRLGAQPSLPSRQEVDSFLEQTTRGCLGTGDGTAYIQGSTQ
jgi:ribokinase